jgi:hypothetical protein
MTGFDKESFLELEKILFRQRMNNNKKRGRPPSLNDRGQLGLYLFFVGSRMRVNDLCLLFGITPACCCVFLNRMISLVVRKMINHKKSRIVFPNEAKKAHYAAIVRNREPLVSNVIAFTDGLSVAVQCSDEEEKQNCAYNGYYHDTSCNNVLTFSPEGIIINACINFPGSWHDSQVVSGHYYHCC